MKRLLQTQLAVLAGLGFAPACSVLPTTLSVFETLTCGNAVETCEIERKINFLGCQSGGEIIPGAGCDACPTPPVITPDEAFEVFRTSDQTIEDAVEADELSCKLVFVQDGSFRYCYPNAAGSMTCITF